MLGKLNFEVRHWLDSEMVISHRIWWVLGSYLILPMSIGFALLLLHLIGRDHLQCMAICPAMWVPQRLILRLPPLWPPGQAFSFYCATTPPPHRPYVAHTGCMQPTFLMIFEWFLAKIANINPKNFHLDISQFSIFSGKKCLPLLYGNS